jgi:hypothetical protein
MLGLGEAAVEPLCGLLGDRREPVRRIAAAALALRAAPDSTACLRATLAQGDPVARVSAASSLRWLLAKRQVPAPEGFELAKQLAQDPDPAIRLAATGVFLMFNAEAAVPAVTALLSDPDPAVALTARNTLGEIEVIRRWYHCCKCQESCTPFDRWAGLLDGMSTPAARRMLSLAGMSWSFDTASDHLLELCLLKVSNDTIRTVSEEEGKAARHWIASSPRPAEVQSLVEEGPVQYVKNLKALRALHRGAEKSKAITALLGYLESNLDSLWYRRIGRGDRWRHRGGRGQSPR